MLKIAIVGKTNVGKSTIVNMLARRRMSISHDSYGTTRDRKDVECEIKKCRFIITDTAGLEKIDSGSVSRYLKKIDDRNKVKQEAEMYEQMIAQSIRAIQVSDAVLFVVDGVAGVNAEDYYFAEIVRRFAKKVVLIVNKCESEKKVTIMQKEIYKFGFGEPFYISASHKIGFRELQTEIYTILTDNDKSLKTQQAKELEDGVQNDISTQDEDDAVSSLVDDVIQIAIIGRPNAGKSTLINSILGENRLITGDKPGITRDAIVVPFEYKGRNLKLVDTAGIRKNTGGAESIEKASIEETMRAIRLCHVAVLVVDVMDPFVVQDIALAGQIVKEGRNLLVCMNKIDKITDEEYRVFVVQRLEEHIQKLIPDLVEPQYVLLSAVDGGGVDDLFEKIFELYRKWNMRVKTKALNNWIELAMGKRLPPMYRRRKVKIKYAVQVKTRPPLVNLFINQTHKEAIPDSYLRFLRTSFIKTFALGGIPVRFNVIASENPYMK